MLDAQELLKRFTSESERIIGDDLAGIYLHGSLAMGCFNADRSDIDLIVVTYGPLSLEVKREFLEMTAELNSLGPAKGIEMSVVRREVCDPFLYPTPYELHFSAGHLESWERDPEEYINRMNGTDRDLAAHLTMINRRGRCLYGLPINEVFAEIPTEDYMDSIWFDVEKAADEIAGNTMYLTLNLSRVLAYKEEGLVLSKKEGGEWALENIPSEYSPLIEDALKDYSAEARPVYDKELALRYAEYTIARIRNS
ncbi:MAG: DUF4111 domain-containing protein [Oscillospiraceae bacterium]|nr:DUF4111 domain-containing protein [Oscillospiraceae bacterium]